MTCNAASPIIRLTQSAMQTRSHLANHAENHRAYYVQRECVSTSYEVFFSVKQGVGAVECASCLGAYLRTSYSKRSFRAWDVSVDLVTLCSASNQQQLFLSHIKSAPATSQQSVIGTFLSQQISISHGQSNRMLMARASANPLNDLTFRTYITRNMMIPHITPTQSYSACTKLSDHHSY